LTHGATLFGNVCTAGDACVGRFCQTVAARDASVTDIIAQVNPCGSLGLPDCGGFCVDLSSSDSNCGACGNSCPSGFVCCDGSCVDISSDSFYCGRCYNPCLVEENGGSCENYECV